MCSEICEKAPCHIPECRYTVLRGDKASIYGKDLNRKICSTTWYPNIHGRKNDYVIEYNEMARE